MKQWLRHEWRRSGLPLYETNRACGVRNAATRKYFTQDHLWYYPPVEMFERLVAYANRHGRPEGRPYFSVDGRESLTGAAWGQMRAHFKCDVGVTNVWDVPAVRGEERLKDHRGKCVHLNQKPLALMRRIVSASTLPGDVVWEPFGGLCSVAVACRRLGRSCYSAEIDPHYFPLASKRLEDADERSPERPDPAAASRTRPAVAAPRPVAAGARHAAGAALLFST